MKILLTGSSGLVGSALRKDLLAKGQEVDVLVRGSGSSGKRIPWDPAAGVISVDSLEGYDAVVHLGGESIAEGRWTDDKMARIHDSRVDGTTLLAGALAKVTHKPKVLVCASAVGLYGDRGDDILTETSAPGSGFLADVCKAWEESCDPARDAGIRVVNMRIGVVLSNQGGALAKMLLPFKLGVGGKIGNGKQWMSWIELHDLVRAIRHAINTDSIEGGVNAVSPEPVTNKEFTKALGSQLSRPTLIPLPAFGARIALGKMADALLLASTRVKPDVLLKSDFRFENPSINSALRVALRS
ncbi:UNVERIFIED_CONTAM: hypothetical protein GTU68_009587 [Idotea baltica]|nr:hypothetical protein [Idotea baltica]